MSYQLSPDLDQQVKLFLASGDYASEADVLQAALRALEREKEEIAAIQEGIDDMEAGRFRPLDEVDAELRRKHSFLQDA